MSHRRVNTPDPMSDIQVLNVDYTVTNAGNINGGTVVFTNAPANGSVVTLTRNMGVSINTQFSQAQNFNGQNLDNAFERIALIMQQLNTDFKLRCLSYIINSYLPEVGSNFLPPLTNIDNQVWVSQGGKIVASEIETNPDFSTLRSQLASQSSGGGDGTSLIGYYDTISVMGRTLQSFLNAIQNKTNSLNTNGGADLIGFYDVSTGTETTIGQYIGNRLIPPGVRVDFSGITPPVGWLLCNGDAYSRSTYPELFNAITFTLTGNVTSSSNSITGISSTAHMYVGMAITGLGIPTSTTVASIVDGTSITISQNATSSGVPTLTFYPWGAGDGSTTFNVPDKRRRVSIGSGGTASTDPLGIGNVTGCTGGEERHTPTLAETAAHNHAGSTIPIGFIDAPLGTEIGIVGGGVRRL